MSISIINWATLTQQERFNALARPAIAESELLATQVANIINTVKQKGDEALFSLTERFDGVALSELAVSKEKIKNAITSLSSKRLKAIEEAYVSISVFIKLNSQKI